MEILWEGQAPNLFLENFNISGIYLSSPCYKEREILKEVTRF